RKLRMTRMNADRRAHPVLVIRAYPRHPRLSFLWSVNALFRSALDRGVRNPLINRHDQPAHPLAELTMTIAPAAAGSIPAPNPRPLYSLWQMTAYALRLGTLGFGGPVALVGYMHRDLVERR